MKKIFFPVLLAVATQNLFSQYLIVGKDSISVKDYIRDNKYGLENSGTEKSVNATIDFLLLQQLAKEKKADICIFGHTHREYIEEKNGIKFINPGALQDKKYILWAENEFIEKKVK